MNGSKKQTKLTILVDYSCVLNNKKGAMKNNIAFGLNCRSGECCGMKKNGL
jgi:hypothetical protein